MLGYCKRTLVFKLRASDIRRIWFGCLHSNNLALLFASGKIVHIRRRNDGAWRRAFTDGIFVVRHVPSVFYRVVNVSSGGFDTAGRFDDLSGH